jgi:salicylate hydroxylase
MKALVVGGGIGGMATALALARRGADVEVFERASALKEVGAGLQVSPNGAAVLRALGIHDGVAARSVRAQAVVLKDYRRPGEVLRLDLSRNPDRGYLFVHRADLLGALVAAARSAGVALHLDADVSSVVPGPVPKVQLTSGRTVPGDLIVGADGLQSRVRVALNGADAPFFTGQVAWRALVASAAPVAPEVQLYMAPGRHLVVYPLRDRHLVNVVAIQERRTWADEGWHHAGDPDALRAAFADFGAEAQAILAQVDEVGIWGLFRHPVAATWQTQGVALVGDAAHPTLPFLAQGANLALEDAWVLSRRSGDLAAYQRARRNRAARVIAAANRNAWKYHLRFGPVRWIGHQGLRLVGHFAPRRMLNQFDWIYGHDVTAPAGEQG